MNMSLSLTFEQELIWANFGRLQTAFTGRAFADIVAGGNFVVPFDIFGIKLYPSLGIWYIGTGRLQPHT